MRYYRRPRRKRLPHDPRRRRA